MADDERDKIIGQNLARYRGPMSVRELSRRSKVHWNTIANIEGGKHAPTTTTLIDLANALGISLDELVGMPVEAAGDMTKLVERFKASKWHHQLEENGSPFNEADERFLLTGLGRWAAGREPSDLALYHLILADRDGRKARKGG